MRLLKFLAGLEDPPWQLSNWAYALFVQDDWRLSRNLLTLYSGVRYESTRLSKRLMTRSGISISISSGMVT